MNLDDRPFTTSALAAAAGCEPMTFRTWRNRNGLFAELAGGRNWKRFSVSDVCVVRAVKAMTAHGLGATDAISFADFHLRIAFDQILVGDRQTSLVGFFLGGLQSNELVAYTDHAGNSDVKKSNELPEPRYSCVFLEDTAALADVMANTKGILTIIDLRRLAEEVVGALGKE